MRSRRSQAGVRPCSKCAIRRALLFTLVVIALWLSPAPAGAQGTSGTILGTVTDSSGASGAGTTVTVTNVDTGTSGRWSRIDWELPGPASFTWPVQHHWRTTWISESGRHRDCAAGEPGSALRYAPGTWRSDPGGYSQRGRSRARANRDATLGQVVEQKKIEELPLNGRNYLQLLTIGSGAAPIQSSQGGAITGETKREGMSYTVSGQREVSVGYLIDGIDSKSNFEMMAAMQVSLDAIQEFKLQRNAFSAQFGGAPVLVNLGIKTGSNRLHGSLFEFLRNDKFDASQMQDPIVNGEKKVAPFRLNQFGGSVGGPGSLSRKSTTA